MITAIILTKDEAGNIARCIDSLKFCDHVLVVDDGSIDQTVTLATKLGARVLKHPLASDFSAQRNWAMTKVSTGWILFIDADEVVSPELAKEIKALPESIADGLFLNRIDVLWNKKLLHGDAKVSLLRLAKAGKGNWQGKVHETWQGITPTTYLTSPLYHYPHPTVADFLVHINTYSSLKAAEFYAQNRPASLLEIIFAPVWRFVKNYFFKLGLLDDTAGFIHALMMAFYVYLVGSKLFMLHRKHA